MARAPAPLLASPVPADSGLHGPARWRAMFVVSLSVLLSTLDYAVANVALPTIAADIHTSASASIWVINAYQLASVVSLLPMAALGERWGYSRMCQIGLALFVVASVLCAGSTNLPELAAARALQGFGGACIMSVNAALVRFIYPPNELGRGIAVNGVVVAMGVALGPTVASAVLSVAGWPWLFLINLPLGGVAFAFAATSLPRTPLGGGALDWTSAGLNAAAFGALIVGGDSLAHSDGGTLGGGLLVAGAAGLVVLVRRQLGRTDPLLPIDLLGLPDFRLAFAVGFLGFVASNFFIIAMPFHLEQALGRTAVATGLLMTPWPLAIVAVAPLVGRLADRYPAGLLSSAGLAVAGCGFVALRLMPHAPGDLDIAWRIGLAGAGFGLLQPPNNRAMLIAAPASRTGSASGMISVARLLGQTVGAMLVALTFGLVGAGATRTCLALAAATAFLAAGLSATRLRRPGVPG